MAELIAILKAITHEARQGETERNIYTDSLNSLHDLQRMIHSPHTMSTHEYRDILTFILKEATSKKDCEGQPLHVHLYKVKAHVNILGNEKADHFAKESYSTDSTAEHITLFRHHTSTHKQWLYDVKGTDPITIKEANSQIEASILKTAAKEVKYIEQWTQKDDSEEYLINHKASSGFHNSTWRTRKRVLQCRADTLLTQHLKHRFKLQPSPFCPMCKMNGRITLGTVSHTLSGCTDPTLRSQHIHRHNGAVRLIHKALKKGYLGSKLILSDGGKDPSNEIRPSRTIPHWLLPPESAPLPPIPNKPDLVMLWKDNMIPEWNKTYTLPRG